MTTLDRLTRVAARVGVSVSATRNGDRVMVVDDACRTWEKYPVRVQTLDDACRQIAHRAGVGSVTCREAEDLDALLDLALNMTEGGDETP
jgi:hypothetical protein